MRALASNQGNAGQAWRTRKPIWTTNLVLDMCLPHSLGVSEAELRGGVWFAVKTDTAIYGVIELLARKLPYKSPEASARSSVPAFASGLCSRKSAVNPRHFTDYAA